MLSEASFSRFSIESCAVLLRPTFYLLLDSVDTQINSTVLGLDLPHSFSISTSRSILSFCSAQESSMADEARRMQL